MNNPPARSIKIKKRGTYINPTIAGIKNVVIVNIRHNAATAPIVSNIGISDLKIAKIGFPISVS